MKRPPRPPEEPIVSRYFMWRIAFVSFLMLIATFGFFQLEIAQQASIETERTIAVNTLVMCQITYLFNARFLSAPSMSWQGLFGSRPVLIAAGLCIIFQILFTYAPWMQMLFGTTGLGFATWAHVIAASVALFAVMEIEKAVFRYTGRRDKARGVIPWFFPLPGAVLGSASQGARKGGWRWRMAAAALAVLVLGGGWLTWSLHRGQRRITSRKRSNVVRGPHRDREWHRRSRGNRAGRRARVRRDPGARLRRQDESEGGPALRENRSAPLSNRGRPGQIRSGGSRGSARKGQSGSRTGESGFRAP